MVIRGSEERPLSEAQVEFNRVMGRLEGERAKLQQKQARLDELLGVATGELLPLVEELNRSNRDLVLAVAAGLRTVKISKKRREWLEDLMCGKLDDLFDDPTGLSDADLAVLEALADELDPPLSEDEAAEMAEEEFFHMRTMLEDMARLVGVTVDFSDLDASMDPYELEDTMRARVRAAMEEAHAGKKHAAGGKGAPGGRTGCAADGGPDGPAGAAGARRARKPSKAQVEKARRLAEMEELRKRDVKALYKQLAKALHPDLESDPQLRDDKEAWMKRVTGAYAAGDLRELLQIEMEWLGAEAGNLANASEAKLKVYCAVLKEQIAGVKEQARWLGEQPQYAPLRRFTGPLVGPLPSLARVKPRLAKVLAAQQRMLEDLNKPSLRRSVLEHWADYHARFMRSNPDPW